MSARHPAKPRRGRPPLGDKARNQVLAIKFSRAEIAQIEAALARENAEAKRDGDDGPPSTVSSWIRDHALDPFAMATGD